MNTDNDLTTLLVTRELDGDIRLGKGRTQKFLAAAVHSLISRNGSDRLPVLSYISTSSKDIFRTRRGVNSTDLKQVRSLLVKGDVEWLGRRA